MKKTKILLLAAAAATLIATAQAAYADDDISIIVNGQRIQTETPAVIVNERTLVPLRAVTEAFGCDVNWDGASKGITLTDGESLYFTWIGRDHAFKTSSMALEDYTIMDAPPEIMNDFTMVPLRAISELFGANVNWDGASRTVTVDYNATAAAPSGLAEKFVVYEQVLDKRYEEYSGYVDGTGNVIRADLEMQDGNVITLDLYPDIAPETVSNFVKLAKSGFYNGLIFHRVISGFMVQGGGFDEALNEKRADTIAGEFIENGHFNLIPHDRGTISMARTMASMDSASSQFFIVHEDSNFLDGQYAAFGKVSNGMTYVDQLASVPTQSISGMDDVPIESQIIKSITIKD